MKFARLFMGALGLLLGSSWVQAGNLRKTTNNQRERSLQVAPDDWEAQVTAAIVDGIAWLADQQQPEGSWPSGRNPGTTAMVVLKLESYAIEQGLDPLKECPEEGDGDPDCYEYAGQVNSGLDYLATRITPCRGHLAFICSGSYFYHTAIALMAFSATSSHPGATSIYNGMMPYKDIVEEIVDFFVQEQANCETNPHHGGWRYSPGCSSDASNTGWITLGLGYAQAPPPYGYDVDIDQVKNGLAIWIPKTQQPEDGSPDAGGQNYIPNFSRYLVNILKTGHMLYEMALVGMERDSGDPGVLSDVDRAVAYIERNWNAPGGSTGAPGWVRHLQAMYTMMKGLEAFGIDELNLGGETPTPWFPIVATHILSIRCGGEMDHWCTDPWVGYDASMATAWALLTLERYVPVFNEPPTAVCNQLTKDTGVDNCVASASAEEFGVGSMDPDDDALTFSVDHPGPYGLGTTNVVLTVEDGNGGLDACDDASITVTDTVLPTIACPTLTAFPADAGCKAIIGDIFVSTSANDNCGVASISQSPSAGTEVGLGGTDIELTAMDTSGNQEKCNTVFTVVDETLPTIDCPTLSAVPADAGCKAIIGDISVSASANDNCGVASISQSPSAGTEVGLVGTDIELTAFDTSGNINICNTVFTVVDETLPTIDCPTLSAVPADAGCKAIIGDISVSASANDNCGVASISQSPSAGTEVGLGGTDIELTAFDTSGNINICNTVLTVVDHDNDGVCGIEDLCHNTVLPEESVPSNRLGTNRWAVLDESGEFSTNSPNGKGPERSYTLVQAGGCSCEQIISTCGYGQGHVKFGCSISVMDWWTGTGDRQGQEPFRCKPDDDGE